ncbi:hypothetical protein [Natronobiforma cellulositropha]|uniref:hypothetical protein n=1 Tax=Natronobiforma cellulositropha TaxID=1679076 RepID=UPI0021D5BB69|nr:hypothetical protein [Natronobiforma cellulositropha]
MNRYATDVRNDRLHLETDDGWIEIGPMDDIVDLVGGETYAIQYDERQRQMSWLDTDEDGTLTFDVRETLERMDYDQEFVENLVSVDGDATDEAGYPLRASVFADLMTSIWDSKGSL